MNTQDEIAALNAEYAASKGIGLTQAGLRDKADECTDTGVWEDATVELYFEWDDYTDRRYLCPNTKLLGAVVYGNDSGEIEAIIGHEDAITRWGQSIVLGLEADSAERAP